MPHLEEQFPPVNPLVLQRLDAVDPPDREEDDEARPIGGQAEDEIPLPGSLADGIDRVTISANARVIVPIQPDAETVPLPADLIPGENEVNLAVPELLDIASESRDLRNGTPTVDEEINAGLQNFLNVLETRRREEALSVRSGLNPIEPRPAAPEPAVPVVQNAVRETREEAASRIENQIADEPPPVPITAPEAPSVTEIALEQDEGPIDENRFVPFAPPPRGPLSVETDDVIVPEPAEDTPTENTLGIRGNTPIPRTEGRVNILTPPDVGEEPPGINIQETRNLGQGRALSLDLATAGNENTFVTLDTVDEVLEEAGVIARPDAPEPQAEILPPPSSLTGVNALPDLADIPGPEGRAVETSFLVDTRQVFEDDQEAQALQAPAFPELDPDAPFIPDVQPEAREEEIPVVAQQPLNVPPPAFENVVPPVAPPVASNVEVLNENPQALRRDNLGTDPALRGNRELRNFLQEFNNRVEPPEEVTESEGAPVAEVQNNAPPPPAVFENLEAESAELLDRVRERQATQGVTRPEEERTAPPEPRTPETVLTERGQNIDRFI